jgi:hypothetical protein
MQHLNRIRLVIVPVVHKCEVRSSIAVEISDNGQNRRDLNRITGYLEFPISVVREEHDVIAPKWKSVYPPVTPAFRAFFRPEDGSAVDSGAVAGEAVFSPAVQRAFVRVAGFVESGAAPSVVFESR